VANRAHLDGDGAVAKGVAGDPVRKELPMLPLVLSSDSRVFEPTDLWQTRIDRAELWTGKSELQSAEWATALCADSGRSRNHHRAARFDLT
jgi:hypothetical protein